MAVDAPLASFPLCSDPDPILPPRPRLTLREVGSAVSRKTSKANVPVLSQMFTAGHPLPKLSTVPVGTSGPKGKGQAGDFSKAGQLGQSGPGRKGRLSFPLVPLPQGPLWNGVHVRRLPVGQPPSQPYPGDPPPPFSLPQRANQSSSWVSRESGNKGKESHFLSRGRKEAEMQPVSHPVRLRAAVRAGTGRLAGGGSPRAPSRPPILLL